MRVARCIPPDKIDWTYARAKFTLGDLLRHLAVTERYSGRKTCKGAARYNTGKELSGRLRQCDGVCRMLARGIDGNFRTTHR